MNYIICLDRNNQVLCWGDMYTVDKYINQLYSITSNEVRYDNYSISESYSCFYEDYEVYNVQGTGVYLTLGEIKMVKEGCLDEMRGIRYIKEELENLMTLKDVYNQAIMDELSYMKSFMEELSIIHTKYNAENLFTNLDIDALHSSYQMERENKGLPIVFIK